MFLDRGGLHQLVARLIDSAHGARRLGGKAGQLQRFLPPDRSIAARAAAYAALAIGLSSFAWFNWNIAATRGLWFDEYITLFLADPTRSLSNVAADIHPPLYYFLVRTAQLLGLEPQPALWVVNLLFILIFFTIILAFLRRVSHPLFGIAALGAILAGPAVLVFALEGRSYVIAQFATMALGAGALARLDGKPRSCDLPVFAALALTCAAIHLYAALFAGAIGVALACIGVMERKSSHLILGLVICATAAITTGIWAAITLPLIAAPHKFVTWVPNSPSYTLGQYWFFNKTLSGWGINVALLLGGTAICAVSPFGRRYVLFFGIVALIFLILPLLVSIKRPMLAGRYLAVGAPALLLIALFAGWRTALADGRAGYRLGSVGAILIALFAIAGGMAAHGVAARIHTDFRYPYNVAEVASALGKSQRLRVLVPDWPMFGTIDVSKLYEFSYRQALGRPDVSLESSLGAVRDVADYPGRVVAWGEHVVSFNLHGADLTEILERLRLTNIERRPLRVVKHNLGFILLTPD